MKILNRRSLYLLLTGSIGVVSCQDKNVMEVTVENRLGFDRNEVVAVNKNDLKSLLETNPEDYIRVKKKGSEDYLRTQWIDNDQDGTFDELLFQADVAANASTQYELTIDSTKGVPESAVVAYSRFVPERTDDYTWENDKVAFRTYGPEAQRLVEENEPGGTLSSGIDLWLKKVNYSIIDDWYAKNDQEPGYYHIDHGEGYDPYHVGKSRGTGGIGIWTGDSLLTSKNFTAFRTIASGPLRTVFELDYEPWSEFGVKETKRISLDLGSNFSKFEISLASKKPVPNYTIGITLHEGKGDVRLYAEQGWFRHWEQIDEAFVGEGIVIDPALIKEAFAHQSETPDQRQLLILTYPAREKLIYYAGFGWTKSNQISSKGNWDAMLERQALLIANPLKVTIK